MKLSEHHQFENLLVKSGKGVCEVSRFVFVFCCAGLAGCWTCPVDY